MEMGLLTIVLLILVMVTFSRVNRLRADVDRLRAGFREIEDTVRLLAVDSARRRAASQGTQATPQAVHPAEPARPTEPTAAPEPAKTAEPLTAEIPQPVPSVDVPPRTMRPVDVVAASETESIESRIGGRWLLYIGMATLLLGLAFFIKYAFDNQWITETGRVVLGTLAGLVMAGGGLRLARRGYPLFGEVLAGGGIVALYLSSFAALNFYGLISRPTAFGQMVIITAVGALMADRQRSQGLAFVALLGGFLTPFLVGGDQDAQVVLLTYDAILVAGTIGLMRRHGWALLCVASYVLTAITFSAWAGQYYHATKYVTTEVFLTLYCAMFLYMLAQVRRFTDPAAAIAQVVLWSAPIVYHLSSVANLYPQSLPLLVYLTLVTLVGVMASIRFDTPWLRLAVFLLVMPVYLTWLNQHTGAGWRVASVVVLLAIYGMHLVAQAERLSPSMHKNGNLVVPSGPSRKPDGWLLADLVLLHANGLALFAGLYVLVDASWPQMTALLALVLAAWQAGLAWYLRRFAAEPALNVVGVAFTMVGFAIGLQFDDWWAVVGWAIEAGAVVWVGLRSRREWMRLGGALLMAGTLVRLFSLGFLDAPSGFTMVFNARVGATLVIVAVFYALAIAHRRWGRELSDQATPEIATLFVGANILTILLMSTEISFFWQARADADAAANLGRMASLSLAWGLYGTALIVIGIVRRYAPIRYLAIALLLLTVGKVFLVDLSQLGGIYRIIGFIGLGLFLLLAAWLYQRYKSVIIGSD